MKEFNIEDRVAQAVTYFQSGYNCAQSVFLAYSDLFDIDMAMAEKMSVSFGGGLGRMREVCGTVSAMSMLAGFRYPVLDTLDRDARKQNYQIVQKMAELFKEKNGAIVCRNLLRNIKTDNSPMPSDRTAEYYKKRPCARIVADAAQIAGRMLKGELEE
ncbi:C-GCAxxG-C-C family protein [Parabacteroides sp. OttesenSCG-928-G07]|nr:C-GCAxxG-C-C family protein [Parabacteroides sp. OttesenSCG-928-G07]